MPATAPAPLLQKQLKSLSDVFNYFGRETAERYPDMEGRFVIMDVKRRMAYGVDELDLKKIGLTQSQVLNYLDNHSITTGLSKYGGSSRAFRDRTSGLNIIFFNERVNETAFNGKEIRGLMHVLDHERGHLCIEDGYYEKAGAPGERLGECVADASALMSHYQRFGTGRECVDKYVSPFSRASSLIFDGDASHFTSFVLKEIIKCRHAIDFANLDPEKTDSIARQFARQYMPPIETVRELQAAFKNVRVVWPDSMRTEKARAEEALRRLIEVTLDPKSSYAVFRTGNIWLQKYLEGHITIRYQTLPISNEDKQTLSRKLQEREYHFARLNKPARRRATPQAWKMLGLGS
jgi:hypothetical protein